MDYCGKCGFCKKDPVRRKYYCQWKLQIERTKSDGDERKAYVRYNDPPCENYDL